MRTLTVRLPDALVVEIERESQSRRVSKSDVARERLSETLPDPVVVTTDADFRIYRRHSRQVIRCWMP